MLPCLGERKCKHAWGEVFASVVTQPNSLSSALWLHWSWFLRSLRALNRSRHLILMFDVSYINVTVREWNWVQSGFYRWSFAPASIGHNRIHPKMFPKNNVQSEIIQNWKFFLNCMFWLAYIDFKRFQMSDRWWWWWLQCRRMRHFELWNNLADIMQPTFLIQMRSKGL